MTDAAGTSDLAGSAARGARTTLVGQLIRVLVQMATLVVLGRLLTPTDYGYIAMAMVVVGVADVVREFGLSSAAVQARELTPGQKNNLFAINTALGVVLAAVLYLAAPLVADLFAEPVLVDVTRALSAMFVINGVATQFRSDLARRLRFGALTTGDVAAQVAALVVGIGMAVAGYGYWALVGSELARVAVVLLLAVAASRWRPGLPDRRAPIGDLLRYSLPVLGASLLGYSSRNIDRLVIGNQFGAAPSALYNRAFQVLSLPLSQLIAPAGRVALPVLSRLQDDRPRFGRFLHRGHLVVVHAVTLLFAYVAAAAAPLIGFVLGPQWAAAAPYLQVLTVAGVFQTASYGCYWGFMATGRTRYVLWLSAGTIPVTAALVLGGSRWGPLGVAVGYAVTQVLVWPAWLALASRLDGVDARGLAAAHLRAVVGYGAAGAVGAVVPWQLANLALPVQLLLTGVVTVLVAALVTLCWPRLRRDAVTVLHSRELLRHGPQRAMDPSHD